MTAVIRIPRGPLQQHLIRLLGKDTRLIPYLVEESRHLSDDKKEKGKSAWYFTVEWCIRTLIDKYGIMERCDDKEGRKVKLTDFGMKILGLISDNNNLDNPDEDK